MIQKNNGKSYCKYVFKKRTVIRNIKYFYTPLNKTPFEFYGVPSWKEKLDVSFLPKTKYLFECNILTCRQSKHSSCRYMFIFIYLRIGFVMRLHLLMHRSGSFPWRSHPCTIQKCLASQKDCFQKCKLPPCFVSV